MRHNSLAKVLSELLNEAGCYDVVLEPSLQQLTGEVLPLGSNTADNARLDVSCRNFSIPFDFTDFRFFMHRLLVMSRCQSSRCMCSMKTEEKRM